MSDSDCNARHPETGERCHLQYDHEGAHVAWRGVVTNGLDGLASSGGSVCWTDRSAEKIRALNDA